MLQMLFMVQYTFFFFIPVHHTRPLLGRSCDFEALHLLKMRFLTMFPWLSKKREYKPLQEDEGEVGETRGDGVSSLTKITLLQGVLGIFVIAFIAASGGFLVGRKIYSFRSVSSTGDLLRTTSSTTTGGSS
jgi:hypothetical protein